MKRKLFFIILLILVVVLIVLIFFAIFNFIKIKNVEKAVNKFEFEMDRDNLINEKIFCDNIEPIIYQKADERTFKKIVLMKPLLAEPAEARGFKDLEFIKGLDRWQCPLKIMPRFEYVYGFCPGSCDTFIFPVEPNKEYYLAFRNLLVESKKIPIIITNFDQKKYEEFILLRSSMKSSKEITIWFRDKLKNFLTEFTEIRSLIQEFDGKLIYFTQSDSFFDVRFPDQEKLDLFKAELKKRNELMKVITEF